MTKKLKFSFRNYSKLLQKELSSLNYSQQLIWATVIAATDFKTYGDYFRVMNFEDQYNVFQAGLAYLVRVVKKTAVVNAEIDVHQKALVTACVKTEKKLHHEVPNEAGLLSVMGTVMRAINFAKTRDPHYLTSLGFARMEAILSIITYDLKDIAEGNDDTEHPLLQAEFDWHQEIIAQLLNHQEQELVAAIDEVRHDRILIPDTAPADELAENDTSYLAEPRTFTFADLDDLIKTRLSGLPFEKVLYFGTWLCDRLSEKYQAGFSAFDHTQVSFVVSAALSFLRHATAAPAEIDHPLAASYLGQLQEILETHYEEFDQDEPAEIGMLKLLECLEATLLFIRDRNPAVIAGCAEAATEVIDVIMTNELLLDTNDPNKHINHPLMKGEIAAQLGLLDRLKS